MSMNRRKFIRQATFTIGSVSMTSWLESASAWAQGGPECTLPTERATPWVPDERKVLKRFSTAEMGQAGHVAALAKFRDAICKIHALPSSDVIGWDKQIAQHCLNCAPSKPDNIHFSQYFLPWHRAFLYSLERILRKLSGDDDLRLMYWNWEQDRTVPAIYTQASQYLFYANRSFQGLSPSDVNVQPLLTTATWAQFGGGGSGQTGAAFGGPHANVHDAFLGDMSDLQFSPRDPIFYAHHGNIDRLWSSWVAASHANPDFGTDKVYFYDQDRKFRSILLNDVRDEKKLGYEYSSLMKIPVRIPIRVYPILLNRALVLPDPEMLTKITTETVESRTLVVHNIKGLEKFPQEANTFGIFADEEPKVGAEAEREPGFLGKVAAVKMGEANVKGPLTAALDLTPKLAGLLNRDKKSFRLAIAPVDRRTGKTTASAVPLDAEKVALVE
ncbi:MAG TPA: tyrosinase family protein [Candidatus Angelobacter sp.]